MGPERLLIKYNRAGSLYLFDDHESVDHNNFLSQWFSHERHKLATHCRSCWSCMKSEKEREMILINFESSFQHFTLITTELPISCLDDVWWETQIIAHYQEQHQNSKFLCLKRFFYQLQRSKVFPESHYCQRNIKFKALLHYLNHDLLN